MKVNKIFIIIISLLTAFITADENLELQVDRFFIREGVAPLLSQSPYMNDEVKLELNRTDSTVPGEILSSLEGQWDYEEDTLKFNSDITVTTEVYFHNEKDYLGWEYDFFDRKPFINVGLDFQVTEYINASVEFPLMKDRLIADRSTDNWTNVIYNMSDLDMNIPNKAVINMGIPHLGFSFGRDLIKMGEGLLVSPNTFYHDFLKLSTYWKNFRYDFTFIALGDENLTLSPGVDKKNNNKMLIAHGLGFNINNKVSINVVESVMLGGGEFNMKVLNPFLILHNEYLSQSDYANAFMTINIVAAPVNRVQVYGELAVDQYATPYENGAWEQEEPNAIGWIIGARTLVPINKLELDINASFVHTDPYLGLDSSGINFTTTKNYVTHSQPDDDANGIPVTDFLGIGPDKQIFTLSCDVVGIDRLTIGMEYQLKRLGDINTSSVVKTYDKDTLDRRTPSGDADTINIITLKAGYDITDFLYGYSQVSYVNHDSINDVQFILSLSYLF